MCLSRIEAQSKPEFGICLWSLSRKMTCPSGMTSGERTGGPHPDPECRGGISAARLAARERTIPAITTVQA